MIPSLLTIEGLYSYQERQTIDFNQLTEAGLFGIFGKVGSGKSSILEAITFALYGNSDRLGGTNFAYNMMNLKSNKLYIEFEFYNHENKLYKITREYKRNSKNFDKITNSGVVLYQKTENKWIPLESSDVEPILGLSSENFRRTIIIPQGKFQEFIQLKSTDRTHMMKEIFNLYRYDLQDKVSILNGKNLTDLNILQGKLSGFEEISEENIQFLDEKYQLENEFANQLREEFNQINEKFQQLKLLKNDFETLNQKQIDFEKLSEQKIQIDQTKAQLDLYERIFTAFNQLLNDSNRLYQQLENKSLEAKNHKKQLTLLENELIEITKNINILEPEYETLNTKKLEENDLQLIRQSIDYQLQINTNKTRLQNGIEKVNEVKTEVETLEKTLKTNDSEIQELSKTKIDSSIIMNAGNWFLTHQNLFETQKKHIQKTENQDNKLKIIFQSFEKFSIKTNYFDLEFNQKIKELENQKLDFNKSKTQLQVQEKLAHFAHELHDGEACPLCGALEHPSKLETQDVSNQLLTIDQNIYQIENQINELKNLLAEKKFIEEQIKSDQKHLEEIENQIKKHEENFTWKEFEKTNFEDFEHKKNASILINQQIESKTKISFELREKLENSRKKVERFNEELEKIKREEIELETKIKQNTSLLKVLKYSDYENETIENLTEKLRILNQKNAQIEKDFSFLNEQLNALNPKISAQKTSIELTEKTISELNEELKINQDSIHSALKSEEIYSIEEVKNILNFNLDKTTLKYEIEQFNINYENLKNSIKELESKLNNRTFDPKQFETEQQLLVEKENILKQKTELVIELKTEIIRLKKSFEEKKELLKNLEKLQKRAENLKTIQNLFYKAGFVQYVSSIYLKQLCENANIRFHRMTRNQLSLQINETNDFEIIDYLNEGKSRSVKTLSGGQSFQVSLSLALALAESVQTNAQSDKNFFFIDEGFGTQDSDAVNVVFETLLSLQKENRIVGIISHVEELKDRIPVALSITKDDEKGSIIELN